MSEILEPGVIKGPRCEGGIKIPENSVLIYGPSTDGNIIVPFEEYKELGREGVVKKYSP
jgi:hypothetical protein